MTKKIMILADHDEAYVYHLSNYFMEKVPELELVIYTKDEILQEALPKMERVDILVADDAFARMEVLQQYPVDTKLQLSAESQGAAGFQVIRRYQKTEQIANDILLNFAQRTQSEDPVQGEHHTKTVAFYSPVGGSGKTTLALAVSAAGVAMGYKVLYLNLENIDSNYGTLAQTPGNLSDLFLTVKTKDAKPAIRLLASVGRQKDAGFDYISGMDSILENEEITAQEVVMLLHSAQEIGSYDMIVVDVSSEMTQKTRCLLEEVDAIFCPMTESESSVSQMDRLFCERELTDRYQKIFGKMQLVINEASTNTVSAAIEERGIITHIPLAFIVPKIALLEEKEKIFLAGPQLSGVIGKQIEKVLGR